MTLKARFRDVDEAVKRVADGIAGVRLISSDNKCVCGVGSVSIFLSFTNRLVYKVERTHLPYTTMFLGSVRR
jgi:hypothetical protein